VGRAHDRSAGRLVHGQAASAVGAPTLRGPAACFPLARRFLANRHSQRGITDAGLDFGSLTAKELRTVQAAAGEGARAGARQAAEHVIEDRRKAEVASLRKRLDELSA